MSEELELDISDIDKLQKAMIVLALMASGVKKMEACEKAGVPYRSFRRWEEGGLLEPAVSAIQQAVSKKASASIAVVLARIYDDLPDIIDRAVRDAKGEGEGEGEGKEVIYARDRQTARQWLLDLVLKIGPRAVTDGGRGSEQDFLRDYSPIRQKVTVETGEDGSTTVHIAPPPKVVEG